MGWLGGEGFGGEVGCGGGSWDGKGGVGSFVDKCVHSRGEGEGEGFLEIFQRNLYERSRNLFDCGEYGGFAKDKGRFAKAMYLYFTVSNRAVNQRRGRCKNIFFKIRASSFFIFSPFRLYFHFQDTGSQTLFLPKMGSFIHSFILDPPPFSSKNLHSNSPSHHTHTHKKNLTQPPSLVFQYHKSYLFNHNNEIQIKEIRASSIISEKLAIIHLTSIIISFLPPALNKSDIENWALSGEKNERI